MATANQTKSGPTLGDRWESIKPLAIALVIGLVAGPIISNLAGFQMLRSTAAEQNRMSGVAVQAEICAAQARAATPDTAALAWNLRRDLADRWAVMPGSTEADSGVASACSDLLAKTS